VRFSCNLRSVLILKDLEEIDVAERLVRKRNPGKDGGIFNHELVGIGVVQDQVLEHDIVDDLVDHDFGGLGPGGNGHDVGLVGGVELVELGGFGAESKRDLLFFDGPDSNNLPLGELGKLGHLGAEVVVSS